MSTPVSIESLGEFRNAFQQDNTLQLASSVLNIFNAEEALINRKVLVKNTTNIFNTPVLPQGSPITNQKSSGRCWIFAGTNMLRIAIMQKLNLKEFQLSQSYLFFYDKLEKCNYFLDQFVSRVDEEDGDIEGRLFQHLLQTPADDGGQFDMLINLVEKYGLIPNSLYPDTYSATASKTMNFLLRTKLREFAQILREAKMDGEDVVFLKLQMQKEVYRLLVIFLGEPPLPHEKLQWEFKSEEEVERIEFTPLTFYKDVVGIDLTRYVSLINDPRNSFDRVLKIDSLGNVVGGKEVRYLNISTSELTDYAVRRIKNNKPIFFGTHTPIFTDKKRGIMDEKLFNYSLINFQSNQNKADRIRYRQSQMTHAMLITAVHLDRDGNPVRWKVENSWGETSGQSGYYVMDNQYFLDYVYQIVVEESELSQVHRDLYKDDNEAILLPVWDPMGALATFCS